MFKKCTECRHHTLAEAEASPGVSSSWMSESHLGLTDDGEKMSIGSEMCSFRRSLGVKMEARQTQTHPRNNSCTQLELVHVSESHQSTHNNNNDRDAKLGKHARSSDAIASPSSSSSHQTEMTSTDPPLQPVSRLFKAAVTQWTRSEGSTSRGEARRGEALTAVQAAESRSHPPPPSAPPLSAFIPPDGQSRTHAHTLTQSQIPTTHFPCAREPGHHALACGALGVACDVTARRSDVEEKKQG